MPSSSRTPPKRLAAALLNETPPAQETSPDDLARVAENAFAAVPRARMIPIERIAPSGDNPRKNFEQIDELAASIAASGVLQPLLVRREAARPGYYKLIAGERRLHAARRVQGFTDLAARTRVEVLPCVIRDESDQEAFADSLAENVARNDLTRAEIMDAYRRLRDEYSWGVRQIARRTGRSVGDVSELLHLGDDPHLAPIVRDEVIAPTTASEIRRLPATLRDRAIEGVRAGTITRMSDVQRLRRTADDEQAVRPRSSDHGSGASDPYVATPQGEGNQVFNIEHPVTPPSSTNNVSMPPVQTTVGERGPGGQTHLDEHAASAPHAGSARMEAAALIHDAAALAAALEDSWAAGFFEGAGVISRSEGQRRRTWRITSSSANEDVIRRFAVQIGLGKVQGPSSDQGDSPHWRWTIARPQAIRAFHRRVGPWLGKRFQAEFTTMLEDLEKST